jgi:DNA-directed RNA polymerase subunit beta'
VLDGSYVEEKQLLLLWNSWAEPIISNTNGLVQLIDPYVHHQQSLNILRPGLSPIALSLPENSTLIIKNQQFITNGQVLGYFPYIQAKNKDITRGLTQVSDIFEARVPKDPEILSECTGIVKVLSVHDRKRVLIRSKTGTENIMVIPSEKPLIIKQNQFIRKGDVIVEGEVNPHEVLRLKGVSALTMVILNGVQSVYISQGVSINNKHIEVIVRQMVRYVNIIDPGDSKFFKGDQVERTQVLQENKKLLRSNKTLTSYVEVLFGVTKSSLTVKSFISASSFQETTKILAKASSLGTKDYLNGLKENVILGRIIPAGTGYIYHKIKPTT